METEDQQFIRAVRDTLLVVQNNKTVSETLTKILGGSVFTGPTKPSKRLAGFIDKLSECIEYAKVIVVIPYETHIGEVEALCGSIFMTQKFQKSIKKFRLSLEEVQSNHR